MDLRKAKGTTDPWDLELEFTNSLHNVFPYILEPNRLKTTKYPVLLAVSGGVDSIVLGHLAKTMELSCIWVHCNFHLRGEESDRDMAFVQAAAAEQGVQLLVRHFDTAQYAKEHKLSIEQAARDLRYDLFERLIAADKSAWGADPMPKRLPKYLMTGHHASDQVETMLLNLCRGSGIKGMRGMQFKNKYILRPLLLFKRDTLEGYAVLNGLKWVEDSTNQSLDYRRNFVRHKVLPLLQTQYPHIEDTLIANVERFRQIEQVYQQGLEKYRKRLISYQGKTLRLSVLLLFKSGIAETLLWEVLKDYGFSVRQIPEIEKLLSRQSGSYLENPKKDWRVIHDRRHLLVVPVDKTQAEFHMVIEGEQQVEFQQGTIQLSIVHAANVSIVDDPAIALMDYALVSFPLELRKWKPGDYFYPLGLGKKKKVARLLTDKKLSLQEKQDTWVLVSGGRIIWVVGIRMDDRFKIKGGTQKILKLKLQKAN